MQLAPERTGNFTDFGENPVLLSTVQWKMTQATGWITLSRSFGIATGRSAKKTLQLFMCEVIKVWHRNGKKVVNMRITLKK